MSVDSFSLVISRNTVYSNSEVEYQLTAECSVTPDPDSDAYRLDQNMFVKSTEDASFLRVANASDLGTLKSERASAISLSHTEYRDSIATFSFTDVDTAVAAIPVLRDRVNSSVHNHLTYLKKFSTEDEHPFTYSLPLPSTSQEQRDGYVEAYTNAREARLLSESSVSEAQQTLNTVSYKKDFISDIKSTVCSLEDDVTPASSSLSTIYASMAAGSSSTSAALASLNTATEVMDGGNLQGYTITVNTFSQLKNALNDIIDNALPSLSTASTDLSGARATLELKCNELTALETSLVNQSDTLSITLEELAAEARALAATEASTLRDLSTYCPDVDPSTIP